MNDVRPTYNYAVRVDENGDLTVECTSKGAPSPLLVGGGGSGTPVPKHPGYGGKGSTDPVRVLVGGSGYVPER